MLPPSYVVNAYGSRNITATTTTAVTVVIAVITGGVAVAITLDVGLDADASVIAARMHAKIGPCYRSKTSSVGMSSGPKDLGLFEH